MGKEKIKESVVSGRNKFDFSVIRKLRKRRGMRLAGLSELSHVSLAVISRLERNHTLGDLDTIYKIARAFGISATDLLGMAERGSAQRAAATTHSSDGFKFEEIRYGNIRCLRGHGKAGERISKPKVHLDDYELCWVLKGRLGFALPGEFFELAAGESIQFDAMMEHTYEAIEDSEFLILHIRKEKRF